MSATVTKPAIAPEVMAEIRTVADRAKQGDQTVLPRLRELLIQFPSLTEHYGNLAAQAEQAWAVLVAGSNLYLKECLVQQAAKMRQDLAGATPSPMEKLLVERIVACWLQMNYFDAGEAQAIGKDESPKLAAYRARRQAQAHRNYLSAIAALTTIRKLVPVPVATGAPATPAVTPSAVNGSAKNGRDRERNGQHLSGHPHPEAFEPHNRITDLLDPEPKGVDHQAAGQAQELCGVGAGG